MGRLTNLLNALSETPQPGLFDLKAEYDKLCSECSGAAVKAAMKQLKTRVGKCERGEHAGA